MTTTAPRREAVCTCGEYVQVDPEEIETEVKIPFEVWCECGAGLCRKTSVRDQNVTVEPCARCLDLAAGEQKDMSYEEGFQDGQKVLLAELRQSGRLRED